MIQVRELTKIYKSRKGGSCTALDHISFTLPDRGFVFVVGKSGSGKTTLVNLIPRFYDATRGSVLIDGRDVRDYPLSALRGKIGVVPQRAVLFKGTVRSNLLCGCFGRRAARSTPNGAGHRRYRLEGGGPRFRRRAGRAQLLRRTTAAADDSPRSRQKARDTHT